MLLFFGSLATVHSSREQFVFLLLFFGNLFTTDKSVSLHLLWTIQSTYNCKLFLSTYVSTVNFGISWVINYVFLRQNTARRSSIVNFGCKKTYLQSPCVKQQPFDDPDNYLAAPLTLDYPIPFAALNQTAFNFCRREFPVTTDDNFQSHVTSGLLLYFADDTNVSENSS